MADGAERKPCVACGEMIPSAAVVCPLCRERQVAERWYSSKALLGWVASATAVIGLAASLSGGAKWVQGLWSQHQSQRSDLALVAVQQTQQEYEAAIKRYGEILKDDPKNIAAQDGQVTATMAWMESYHVVGDDYAKVAAAQLDEAIGILDAGLARGRRAADIEAHLGWAHWLNQHIAEREFGPIAERDFRGALKLDPANVYAHAMLGNWLLQTGGSVAEASQHFAAALATGKERPLVRDMQLGGLIGYEQPGARAALVQAANAMRTGGESIDDDRKGRIIEYCCTAGMEEQRELVEALSALPFNDAWATYQWLDVRQHGTDEPMWQTHQSFIHAELLEIAGRKSEALTAYRAVSDALTKRPGSLKDAAEAGIKRTT